MTQGKEDLILAELREQTKWLRLLGVQALRPVLQQVLRTDKQKAVFECSDGQKSSREIAKLTNVNYGTVARWWRDWLALGICVESSTAPGRAQRLASLSMLNLEPPAAVSTALQASANGMNEDEV